jgi:hypothetical protein
MMEEGLRPPFGDWFPCRIAGVKTILGENGTLSSFTQRIE